MTSSGVKINEDVVTYFSKFKAKSAREILFSCKIMDKDVVIDHCSGSYSETAKVDCKAQEAEFNAEVEKLGEMTEPRFFFARIPYFSKDGRDQEDIVFLYWFTDDMNIKKKMLYAATEGTMRTKFQSLVKACIQGSNISSFKFQDIVEFLGGKLERCKAK
ncbi:actophorin-like [Montipora foliosa]|uniref:actophorin-like n=1 Tax=Montipora foliosa TaxID=591990 RepID=UPI0035F1CF2E